MDTHIGSTATYECDNGYTLKGNPQRVCQFDSHRSGALPHCVKHNSGITNLALVLKAIDMHLLEVALRITFA